MTKLGKVKFSGQLMPATLNPAISNAANENGIESDVKMNEEDSDDAEIDNAEKIKLVSQLVKCNVKRKVKLTIASNKLKPQTSDVQSKFLLIFLKIDIILFVKSRRFGEID